MAWTQFWDMHSGGGTKEAPYDKIYIEAPEAEACVIFYNRFGHSPARVTCTCCGEDYSTTEYKTLDEATAYQRNDKGQGFGPRMTLAQYRRLKHVLVIPKREIKASERRGDVPRQGYVWQD